jgi:hypothetical protein
MLPYLLEKGLPLVKFIVIDCSQDLTFGQLSKLIEDNYSQDFHSRCKGFPEYPFGKLE